MSLSLVLHYAPRPVEVCALHAGLQARGFLLCSIDSLGALEQQARALQEPQAPPALALLNGSEEDNCKAAGLFRVSLPKIPILALTSLSNEAAVIKQLEHGADAYCSSQAGVDLIIATLRCLSRYSRDALLGDSGAPSMATQGWALDAKGWYMRTPRGDLVPLTTGERAFLMALFAAPLWQASHQTLNAAVRRAYHQQPGHQARSRIGMLVSRLRRKFDDHGTPLPLQSVHNWGYMFAPTLPD